MKQTVIWGAVLLWLMCILIAMAFTVTNRTVAFDNKMTLSAAIMDISFEDKLIAKLSSILSHSGTIVNFVQGDCYCEYLSKPHLAKLSEKMDSQGYKVVQVNLLDFPELSSFIPSTPSVAVFTDKQHLVYLGPYSQGLGCFQRTGLVDEGLNQYLNNPSELKSAQIITEAQGCYCESEQTLSAI